jgi:hypothetical protein
MTKPSTIPQHKLSITCGLCKHYTMLEVANLIAVLGGDTTAHEVRQRARCNNCGVKSNNTYQIKLRGWRVSVKHGLCKNNSKMGHAVVVDMAHVLAVLHAPKFLVDTVTS